MSTVSQAYAYIHAAYYSAQPPCLYCKNHTSSALLTTQVSLSIVALHTQAVQAIRYVTVPVASVFEQLATTIQGSVDFAVSIAQTQSHDPRIASLSSMSMTNVQLPRA